MQRKVKLNLVDIFKPIEPYLNKVNEEIPKKLLTGIPLVDAGSLHLFKNGGKRIRASLVILCSGLKGEIPADIVDTATAVETFHVATLIHDDIIDQSLIRRGANTVSKEWGNKVAVLTGDYMHIRALQTILNDEKPLLVHELLAAALDMIKGEIYQIEFSGIEVINREHYFNIIELKTAEFMGTCAKLGAMKAEMSDNERNFLYQFGLNIGRAFQIVDDTFDYIEEQNIIGKDTGNDFRSGKITLPIIYLLESAAGKEREKIINCFHNQNEETWNEIKLIIKKYNAIDYCLKAAEEYIKKAIPYLDVFQPSLYKEKIIELADFFISRNY